ncbi:MAG: hypothetical protein ABIT83_15390 [Massilia sp.]
MTKTLLSGVSATALALALTACSGPLTQSQPPSDTTANGGGMAKTSVVEPGDSGTTASGNSTAGSKGSGSGQ